MASPRQCVTQTTSQDAPIDNPPQLLADRFVEFFIEKKLKKYAQLSLLL